MLGSDGLSRVLGLDPSNNLDPDHELRLIRETQYVRVHQSWRAFPLVLAAGAVYILALWDEVPRVNLIAWVSLIVVAALLRTVVCWQIENRLKTASPEDLKRNERKFFWTSILNTGLVGSGFWWVCLEGSDRAVFAVTLLCCIYAIGTTINSSVQQEGLPALLLANLGQAILFLMGVGGEPQPAVVAALGGMLIILIGFGRENAKIFSDSIRIRAENVDLVEQLNRDKKTVEKALETAREANNAKSRFLAAASHDLRQPLHALGLFLGSLRAHIKEDGDAKRIMQRVDETTIVLKEQFDDLLDLSRFDAGGVHIVMREFAIHELLNRVVEEMRLDADRKKLAIDLKACDAIVCTDPLLIDRVIRNLLSNAIRYTDLGSISVLAESHDDEVYISIQDTGRGISEEDRVHVFEDFAQLQNPSRRRDQGAGLGLAIVKRIDDLMGLELKLESSPGLGSKFSFRLPKKRSGQSQEGREQPPTNGDHGGKYHGFRVWAVEDDPNIGEALTLQLRTWGCDVVLASSRQDIEAAFREAGRWPDLILVDDSLGARESGLALAGWMKGKISTDRIVVITGNTDMDELREIQVKGFQLLKKPTHPQDLKRIVSRLYGRSNHA